MSERKKFIRLFKHSGNDSGSPDDLSKKATFQNRNRAHPRIFHGFLTLAEPGHRWLISNRYGAKVEKALRQVGEGFQIFLGFSDHGFPSSAPIAQVVEEIDDVVQVSLEAEQTCA